MRRDIFWLPLWVDLKGRRLNRPTPRPTRFTFHYGWIWKIRIMRTHRLAPCIYIPLWVDLKVVGVLASLSALCIFTFHYGWIWKLRRYGQCRSGVCIYIPLWVDLKGADVVGKIGEGINLHSIMGGFESPTKLTEQLEMIRFTFHYGWIWKPRSVFQLWFRNRIYIPLWVDLKVRRCLMHWKPLESIYIPLWVDLKGFLAARCSYGNFEFTFHYGWIWKWYKKPPSGRTSKNLHSIMGGFESRRWANRDKHPAHIYIPLWVDLKVRWCWIYWRQPMWIYIPLWVDLKVCRLTTPFFTKNNLHSIMGGFESVFVK